MKKFAKISLITAGILLAVGIVFCMVGVAAGGVRLTHLIREDEFLSTRFEKAEEVIEEVQTEVEEHGWSSWHTGWSGNGISISNPTYLKVNGEKADSRESSGQINADAVNELELTLGAGTLYLKEKEEADGKIDISVKGVGEVRYYVEDQTLHVEGFDEIKYVGINNNDNEITLGIPKGMTFSEIATEVGAGTMELTSITAGEFSTEIGAGRLQIDGLVSDRFDAEVGAGEIIVKNATTGEAEISVGMGSGEYSGTIQDYACVECSMGTIDFRLSGKETDYNYNLECAAGGITIGNLSLDSLAGERYVNNNANADLDITCSMGNIEIRFEE